MQTVAESRQRKGRVIAWKLLSLDGREVGFITDSRRISGHHLGGYVHRADIFQGSPDPPIATAQFVTELRADDLTPFA